MDFNFIRETILKQYRFNLHYADQLTRDVPREFMSQSAGPGLENHPSFTIGHLVTATAMTIEDIGGICNVPANWKELFERKGPGDLRKPVDDASLYPEKEKLITELSRLHGEFEIALRSSDEKKLLENCTWRFQRFFPTLLDLVVFMCISHENMHLAQLAAWRRAMHFPSALAEL